MESRKWYEPMPKRNWRLNMIPNLSRTSSNLSQTLQQSLQESEWSSLREFSTHSTRSRKYASPSKLSLKRRKPKIEQIPSKTQNHRPRSVSLTKYEPLPAINSESPKKEMISFNSQEDYDDFSFIENQKSKRSSSVETPNRRLQDQQQTSNKSSSLLAQSVESGLNRMENQDSNDRLDEIEMSSIESISIADEPPKLIRSNTFEVLETSLTNLPIIEDEISSSADEETVRVTVDGVPLLSFIGQTSDLSRPSSHSSLITHPGTPDSGLGVPSASTSTSSSVRFTGDDSSRTSESENEYSFSVILPDSSLEKFHISLDTSLKDFLVHLSSVKKQPFYVMDQVEENLLNKSLLKLGFGTIESVQLVTDT